MKREFLMLAKTFDPERDYVGGWYMSEKLDGIRAFYDGGISRGIPCSKIPWANTAKDARLVKEPIATGLWSRYGKVINAPDYWLDALPEQPLDGELTLGRKTFQGLSSIVRTIDPLPEWVDVKYKVFDSPPLRTVFADGSINNALYRKKFSGIMNWIGDRGFTDFFEKPFYHVHARLKEMMPLHEQTVLPSSRVDAIAEVNRRLIEVEANGGEGLILRNPISFWKPERFYGLLKVKSFLDDEGIVIGYRWAEPTDSDRSLTGEKTDKLLGLMGSLRVRMRSGKEFDLSGFTDAERRMHSHEMPSEQVFEHGMKHPGEVVGPMIYNPTLPRGSTITFRYRELTNEGFPKEGRYLRKRDDL